MRECKICDKKYKSEKYATCSECRRKNNKKEISDKIICSRCRINDIDESSKYLTCEKCRERGVLDRKRIKDALIKVDYKKIMMSPVIDIAKNMNKIADHYELKELFEMDRDGKLEHKKEEDKFDPYYLGGIWDGDGTITICGKDGSYILQVSFSQAFPSFLDEVQKVFGGKVYICKKPDKESCKQLYGYRICGKEAFYILKVLEKGCIIKYNQVKLALEYIDLVNKNGMNDIREKYSREIRDLNKHKYYEVDKPYEKINDAYIAGLFDAEGCICVSLKNKRLIRIKISQKNEPNVLYFIKEYFGYGEVDKKNSIWYVLTKSFRLDFMKRVYPYLIVKSEQVRLAIKYYTKGITKEEKSEIFDLLQYHKHNSIEVPKSNIIKKNELDNKKKINIKKAKKAGLSVSIGVNSWNNGESNTNFGKPMTIERKNKIGKGIAYAKRNYSDSDIEIMKNMVKEGSTYEEIGKLYGIDRNTVSKHCNNKIKSMKDYEEFDTSSIKSEVFDIPANIKTSIGKRRIDNFELCIEILMLKNTMSAVSVSKKYSSFKNKVNGKGITADVVKNIWSGKSKLFTHEFTNNIKITYEKYLEIISQKNTNNKERVASGISNRSVKFDTVIEIVLLKGKDSAKNIGKMFFTKTGKPVPSDTVNKILSGKTKLYEYEFTDDSKLNYNQYKKIVETSVKDLKKM